MGNRRSIEKLNFTFSEKNFIIFYRPIILTKLVKFHLVFICLQRKFYKNLTIICNSILML